MPDTTTPVHLDQTLRIGFVAPLDPTSPLDTAVELRALDGPRRGERARARSAWRPLGARHRRAFVPMRW